MFLNHFNSQPHKEADMYSAKRVSPITAFQLTASQGGWRWSLRLRQCILQISTHSLTRRLTATMFAFFRHIQYFNSQPHKEADNAMGASDKYKGISTHSLTRRLTIGTAIQNNKPANFNSQPHKEADVNSSTIPFPSYRISTHSLTRRLTDTPPQIERKICTFQLTASQGGWQHYSVSARQAYTISTHSLTRRLTEERHRKEKQQWYFNSQPHKEADRSC